VSIDCRPHWDFCHPIAMVYNAYSIGSDKLFQLPSHRCTQVHSYIDCLHIPHQMVVARLYQTSRN